MSGTSYSEVYKKAWQVYLTEKKKSRRRAYVRSAYFNKEKIFLDIFWSHLKQKKMKDRFRRLKFYQCAIELLKKCRNHPVTVQDDGNLVDVLHRFYGQTSDGEKFVVQIKENKRNRGKYFVSVFPEKQKTSRPGVAL